MCVMAANLSRMTTIVAMSATDRTNLTLSDVDEAAMTTVVSLQDISNFLGGHRRRLTVG